MISSNISIKTLKIDIVTILRISYYSVLEHLAGNSLKDSTFLQKGSLGPLPQDNLNKLFISKSAIKRNCGNLESRFSETIEFPETPTHPHLGKKYSRAWKKSELEDVFSTTIKNCEQKEYQ